jgi:hypothetical protein
VETYWDIEEVRRPPLWIEAGSPLPEEPAVIVPASHCEERIERFGPGGPRTGELAGELTVLRLENDVPQIACVTNEHATFRARVTNNNDLDVWSER